MMTIYTIGHSSTELEAFIDALKAFSIKKLIDVRSLPGSRYVPHFNKETLSIELENHGIMYEHLILLGGRRRASADIDKALVCGWKNTSFRNYAAYSLTAEYEEGIAYLLATAGKTRVCIMCAESVPWRCHRLLISNTLVARGVDVFHIMSSDNALPHTLNRYGAYSEIDGNKVLYPQADAPRMKKAP